MGASASKEKQLANLFAVTASRPTDAVALAKLKKLLPKPDPAVANARQPDEDGGCTALMAVVSLRMGNHIGDYLVEMGADLQAADRSGYTVLHWAAMKDSTHFAAKALDSGRVGVDQLTNGKKTALMISCKYQAVSVFRLLMERGADPSIVEPVQKQSALDYAREVLSEADDDDERQRAQEMIQGIEAALAQR